MAEKESKKTSYIELIKLTLIFLTSVGGSIGLQHAMPNSDINDLKTKSEQSDSKHQAMKARSDAFNAKLDSMDKKIETLQDSLTELQKYRDSTRIILHFVGKKLF